MSNFFKESCSKIDKLNLVLKMDRFSKIQVISFKGYYDKPKKKKVIEW